MDLVFFPVLAAAIATVLIVLRARHNSSTGMTKSNERHIAKIETLTNIHETAARLAELIRNDGAGSWPPRANHSYSDWPAAFRPYQEVLQEMLRLLAKEKPSLHDQTNVACVTEYRSLYQELLRSKIDLPQVELYLRAADAGQWDVFPRDTYNALYCCVATSRHAYRWATIPVVKIAQLEKVIDIPPELSVPWTYLQRHFGCTSESGNNTSNLILNFDLHGNHVFQINTGLSHSIRSAEETFARIFFEVEVQAVPIYTERGCPLHTTFMDDSHCFAANLACTNRWLHILVILAVVAFARENMAACATHMETISTQLRMVLQSYYSRMHDQQIPLSVWLPHVQGFFAWGVGRIDEASGDFIRFDGLSGNQVLLFQTLDAFLGIDPYLPLTDQERNIPARQRALCKSFERHSFRRQLSKAPQSGDVDRIRIAFDNIIKRLRLFRTVHKSRAKAYLSQAAPERLPMTAGKSLLKANLDQSLEFLEGFMDGRLIQTA